ncbi:MAG: SagB/ThcOx family dehydrogenase [Anaerolineae bacterium]|nr:SagB/ThcOx family dehydrogenase [Anaerolineae bacterium]
MAKIVLPSPRTDGPMALETAIARRRSIRKYRSEDLTLEQIGQLLWAAQGITGRADYQRAAPSAGGCHPLELYVCRADGIWHYLPKEHALTLRQAGDIRQALASAAWHQDFIAEAPCVFFISAVVARTTRRYHERGALRYVPMDAAHAAQNLLLQAVALGLGGVPIGAFDDQAVALVLSLSPQETPLYILPVGYPG